MDSWLIPIKRKLKVTASDIDDIMCAALEGGICYWCGRAEVVGEYLGEYASEQISRGGTLKLYDCEDMNEVYELDRSKLLKGIKKAFEEGYYSEYEWCNGTVIDTCQVDADVADVIVQIAIFDEVVYG
jgi:hypothetical protein